MSQVTYRGNLSSAFFPFVSRFQGRTVIVPGPDNNFNRQLQSSADTDKDIGIPQMYYCHNVMPNGNGLQSVGYDKHINAAGAITNVFQQIYLSDDRVGSAGRGEFAIVPTGFYICNVEPTWSALITTYRKPSDGTIHSFPTDLNTRQITVAHVGGVSYFFIEKIGMFYWHFGVPEFQAAEPTGITESAVVGITESSGYLVAYTESDVAWSSLISPTDFTPSLITGAGGGSVDGIKAAITCGAPTTNGFILYTEQNAVAALYTGNSQYPFQFSECQGSGGLTTLERVTYDSDSGYNYAYTSAGFQVIKAKSADTVLADVTDFLSGQYFEDFDDVTRTFNYQTLAGPFLKKLAFVANRYLVISYGITELTHALVYDVVQKRFGKFKITHVDCFEYNLLTDAVSDTPRKSIAFIQKDGTVYITNFVIPNTARNGTVMLGKYQYVRARRLALDAASIESPTPGGSFSIYDMVSNDGKNYYQSTPGTVISSGNDVAMYGFGSPDGINHSLLMQGAFALSSIELKFHITGKV